MKVKIMNIDLIIEMNSCSNHLLMWKVGFYLFFVVCFLFYIFFIRFD